MGGIAASLCIGLNLNKMLDDFKYLNITYLKHTLTFIFNKLQAPKLFSLLLILPWDLEIRYSPKIYKFS